MNVLEKKGSLAKGKVVVEDDSSDDVPVSSEKKGKKADGLTKVNVKIIEPKIKLQGETKSKFLDPDSELYFHIYDCQQRLKHAGIRFESRLDPHIELISNKESKEVFLRRAKELHMMEVNVTNKTIYKVEGKIFLMKLPSLSDKEICIKIANFSYLPPHIDRLITVIFDPKYSPYSDWEQTVFD